MKQGLWLPRVGHCWGCIVASWVSWDVDVTHYGEHYCGTSSYSITSRPHLFCHPWVSFKALYGGTIISLTICTRTEECVGIKVARAVPLYLPLIFSQMTHYFLTINNCALKRIIDNLCIVSREIINITKSFIMASSNIGEEDKDLVRTVFGISIGGLRSSSRVRWCLMDQKANHLRSLKKKIVQKLQGWKTKFCFLVGRLVLINNVLGALCHLIFSLCWLSERILQNMDSLIINFF